MVVLVRLNSYVITVPYLQGPGSLQKAQGIEAKAFEMLNCDYLALQLNKNDRR